jgi:hypothetical protein
MLVKETALTPLEAAESLFMEVKNAVIAMLKLNLSVKEVGDVLSGKVGPNEATAGATFEFFASDAGFVTMISFPSINDTNTKALAMRALCKDRAAEKMCDLLVSRRELPHGSHKDLAHDIVKQLKRFIVEINSLVF